MQNKAQHRGHLSDLTGDNKRCKMVISGNWDRWISRITGYRGTGTKPEINVLSFLVRFINKITCSITRGKSKAYKFRERAWSLISHVELFTGGLIQQLYSNLFSCFTKHILPYLHSVITWNEICLSYGQLPSLLHSHRQSIPKRTEEHAKVYVIWGYRYL